MHIQQKKGSIGHWVSTVGGDGHESSAEIAFLFLPLLQVAQRGSRPLTLPWQDTRRAEGDGQFPPWLTCLYGSMPTAHGELRHRRCITLSPMGDLQKKTQK
jgi:hypothetical protein